MNLSIVTCIYNGESFIESYFKNLNSISALVSEVIIINDGSNDETKNLLNKHIPFCKINSIKVYDKANSGLADSRNYSLDYISGNYVLFLDVDDEIVFDSLNDSLSILSSGGFDYLYGDVFYFSRCGNALSNYIISHIKRFSVPSAIRIKYLIFKNNYLVSPGSCIFKSSIFKSNKFNSFLSLGEDWEFFTRVIPKYNGYYYNKFLLRYFVHEKSMSTLMSRDKVRLSLLADELVINLKKSRCDTFSINTYESFLKLNFGFFVIKKSLVTLKFSKIIKEIISVFHLSKGFYFYKFFNAFKLLVFKILS